jgi:hypothetical protein
MNGLASLWVRSCVRKPLPALDALTQWEHTNGVTPLWVHAGTHKLAPALNALQQITSQMASFPCVFCTCGRSVLLFPDVLPHLIRDSRRREEGSGVIRRGTALRSPRAGVGPRVPAQPYGILGNRNAAWSDNGLRECTWTSDVLHGPEGAGVARRGPRGAWMALRSPARI